MMKTKVKRFTPFESPEWSLVQKQESELNQKTSKFFSQSVNGKLNRVKNPKIDLKSQYQKTVRGIFCGYPDFINYFSTNSPDDFDSH